MMVHDDQVEYPQEETAREELVQEELSQDVSVSEEVSCDESAHEAPCAENADSSEDADSVPDSVSEIDRTAAEQAPVSLVPVVEAVLFVNEKPISAGDIASSLGFERTAVEEAIKSLKESYESRNAGLCLIKVAGGWQMRTAEHCVEWVKTLYRDKFKRKLSISALEVLAIIAYQQPITKMELEAIRGVDCDGVLRTLMNMDLVKLRGRKDVVGKPFLYGTTQGFLEHFGLNSLNDLPPIQNDTQIGEELRKMSGQEETLPEESDESDESELSQESEQPNLSDMSEDEDEEEEEDDEDEDEDEDYDDDETDDEDDDD